MKSRSKRSVLGALLFTVFMDVLGIGILIPVMPQLLANPASPSFLLSAESAHWGYVLLGLLIGIYSLGMFFAAPILGQLSDRYGRRPILAISLAGTCLSYIIFAIGIITRNVPLLFISRAFDGITGGNFAVAQAALADISRPEDRAKTFGLVGAVFGIGFVIGPFIGGKLADPSLVSWFNAATPFWFAAILSFFNVAWILAVLPETNKTANKSLAINWSRSVLNIVHAFKLKRMRPLFTAMFLFQAGFAFFVTFFSVFLINKFGYTQGDIGNYFAYVGLWIAFTQAVVTRWVAKRFPEARVLRISLAATGLAILLFFLVGRPWELYFITPLFAIFNGLTQANLLGLISRSADASIQGEILGINTSLGALAQFIPPMLSGFIAAALTPESPLVIAAIVIIISGIFFIISFRGSRGVLPA